jgi:hypothetical protein
VAFADDVRLDLEEIGLDRDDPPQAPEQRGQSKYEFAFDCRPGVVVRDDRRLERLVVFAVFQAVDYGLRGQSMAQSIASRLLFALLGSRPGATECVPPIGFDLSICRNEVISWPILARRSRAHLDTSPLWAVQPRLLP